MSAGPVVGGALRRCGVTDHWTRFAMVARKLSQAGIWAGKHLALLRRYVNLLIRADADAERGYVHHEAHPGHAHPA